MQRMQWSPSGHDLLDKVLAVLTIRFLSGVQESLDVVDPVAAGITPTVILSEFMTVTRRRFGTQDWWISRRKVFHDNYFVRCILRLELLLLLDDFLWKMTRDSQRLSSPNQFII